MDDANFRKPIFLCVSLQTQDLRKVSSVKAEKSRCKIGFVLERLATHWAYSK